MNEQEIIQRALNNAAIDLIAKKAGLTSTLWDWLLPWRARHWQTEAKKIVARLAAERFVTFPREELWDAINEYAAACGGDTSDKTVSNRRMEAVAAVEKWLAKGREQ